MPKSFIFPQFNIVRHVGDANSGRSPLGFEVHRTESIFVPEYRRFIPCIPYDNHFIYEIPKKYKNTPAFMCSCGSMAVIAGLKSYENDASPSGLVLICYQHSNFGKHADGSS